MLLGQMDVDSRGRLHTSRTVTDADDWAERIGY